MSVPHSISSSPCSVSTPRSSNRAGGVPASGSQRSFFVRWPMKAVTQPRAFETREKILQAASRLFALKGYHDTKLEEVLGTAQVSKGAFFHQVRDREDLGFAVLDWHMDRRRQLLDAIEQEMSPDKQTD